MTPHRAKLAPALLACACVGAGAAGPASAPHPAPGSDRPARPAMIADADAGAPQVTRSGRYYRWTDEQGRVQFSDKPPPGTVEAEVREHRVPRADPDASPAYAPSTDEVARSLEAAREAREAERDEAAAARRERCEAARARLARLARWEGWTVARKTDDGEMEYLSDERRAAIEADARSAERRYCGG